MSQPEQISPILDRILIDLRQCDECRIALFRDDHPPAGCCACECHLSDGDLAYIKWFTRHREGE